MPRFYCEYCDVFLTRDSKEGRLSHNLGWRHKKNVRDHYTKIALEETQKKINELVREYELNLMSGEPIIVPIGPHGHPGIMPPPGAQASTDALYQTPITQAMVDAGEFQVQSSNLQQQPQAEGQPLTGKPAEHYPQDFSFRPPY